MSEVLGTLRELLGAVAVCVLVVGLLMDVAGAAYLVDRLRGRRYETPLVGLPLAFYAAGGGMLHGAIGPAAWGLAALLALGHGLVLLAHRWLARRSPGDEAR